MGDRWHKSVCAAKLRFWFKSLCSSMELASASALELSTQLWQNKLLPQESRKTPRFSKLGLRTWASTVRSSWWRYFLQAIQSLTSVDDARHVIRPCAPKIRPSTPKNRIKPRLFAKKCKVHLFAIVEVFSWQSHPSFGLLGFLDGLAVYRHTTA